MRSSWRSGCLSRFRCGGCGCICIRRQDYERFLPSQFWLDGRIYFISSNRDHIQSDMSEDHMRIRARKYPGRDISTVTACMWPKSRYWLCGPHMAKNWNSKYADRDRQEVIAYIAQNGPSSCYDVELCCHMEKKAATRILVALEGQHVIERCYFGGEKWRAIK